MLKTEPPAQEQGETKSPWWERIRGARLRLYRKERDWCWEGVQRRDFWRGRHWDGRSFSENTHLPGRQFPIPPILMFILLLLPPHNLTDSWDLGDSHAIRGYTHLNHSGEYAHGHQECALLDTPSPPAGSC